LFRPFTAFIGLRYIGLNKRNNFISFISLTSLMGIALGVMALITVLSVMNGFHHEIRSQMLGVSPHLNVRSSYGNLEEWLLIQKRVQQHPDVVSVSAFILGQGILLNKGSMQGVLVAGLENNHSRLYASLKEHLKSGSLENLTEPYQIWIGKQLSQQLGLLVGDKVTVMVPETLSTGLGLQPRLKRFTVAGIFALGPLHDSSYVFVSLPAANTLFRMQGQISTLQVNIKDEFRARALGEELQNILGGGFIVTDWTAENAPLLRVLNMEKVVMSFILLLIIAVAGFNLVSTLVMMVTDKKSDIAILRAMGAHKKHIIRIFMIQGTVIGALGTVIGLVAGLIVSFKITDWVKWLQSWLHWPIIPADIYFINYLPAEILASDVIKVCLSAFMMSFLATIYPAWKAAKIAPAEALRYE